MNRTRGGWPQVPMNCLGNKDGLLGNLGDCFICNSTKDSCLAFWSLDPWSPYPGRIGWWGAGTNLSLGFLSVKVGGTRLGR